MWLGFGLNVAPLILKSIINAVMSQDQTIKSAMLAYVNDIYISENLVSASHVRKHLSDYGFVRKGPEHLQECARVLGLQVWWGRMEPSDGSREMKSQMFPMLLPVEACSPCKGNLWVIFPSVADSGWSLNSSSTKQMQYPTARMPRSPMPL